MTLYTNFICIYMWIYLYIDKMKKKRGHKFESMFWENMEKL